MAIDNEKTKFSSKVDEAKEKKIQEQSRIRETDDNDDDSSYFYTKALDCESYQVMERVYFFL